MACFWNALGLSTNKTRNTLIQTKNQIQFIPIYWYDIMMDCMSRCLLRQSSSAPPRVVHSSQRRTLFCRDKPIVSVRSQMREEEEERSHDVLYSNTMGRREIVSYSALMLLTTLPVHAEQQGEATAYDFHLKYQGNDFPLEYLKNKVTVFVNVASE